MKSEGSKILPNALILLVLITILSGVGMAYFSVPSFLQPIHLTVATLTFGLQFLLALQLNYRGSKVLTN